MSYHDDLEKMPDDVRKVADDFWDETGRPTDFNSYVYALIALMNISDNFEGFLTKYAQLFPTRDMTDEVFLGHLKDYWRFYFGGLKRCADTISKDTQ